jgi:hypothetical protein
MVVNFTPADMMENDRYASNDVLRDHVLIRLLEDAYNGPLRSPSDEIIDRLIAYSATVPVTGTGPVPIN